VFDAIVRTRHVYNVEPLRDASYPFVASNCSETLCDGFTLKLAP
jgi:hypothetical protein